MLEFKNITKLFRKDILIYSIADYTFSSPLRASAILYGFILTIIFGPLLFFLPINVYSVMFVLGIIIGGANLMSKPIWGEKSFYDWFTTQIKFLIRPKIYYDLKSNQKSYKLSTEHIILLSRKSDIEELEKNVNKSNS